ncbi:MAG TPA: pilus assembly protein [Verrucomicrobiae bacterium]|nr:pilus assembly protein [Verrucomicrobiae bacterium]
MKKIADTGLLAAALDRSDAWHGWGAAQLRQNAPFYTCDAVLAELAFVIDNPIPGLKLVARGDLILDFDLAANLARVLDLLERYADRRMELADACLVRMTELTDACKVWTVDKGDFRVYRRHGRGVIPCEFPKS